MLFTFLNMYDIIKPTMNFLGIIKAHKLASAVVSGTIVALGAAGATFAIMNAQKPINEPETSQITPQDENTDNDSELADVNVEESQNEAEIGNEAPTATPSQQAQTEPAQPEVDIEAFKQNCLNQMQIWFSDIAKSPSRYNGLTAEEKVSYGSSLQYQNKVIADYEAWRISSGCADYAKVYPNY